MQNLMRPVKFLDRNKGKILGALAITVIVAQGRAITAGLDFIEAEGLLDKFEGKV